MAFYSNYDMLAYQYGVWSAYPQSLKDDIEIVVVDDGSPDGAAVDVERPEGLPKLRIYRFLEDIPWNQDAARNLGVKAADYPWIFMTDMDHVLPATSLERLLAVKNKSKFYTFPRIDAPTLTPTVDASGNPKPHINTYAMTQALFWQVGGYDESYRGIYGTDGIYRRRLMSHAEEVQLEDAPIIRFSREIIHDASTRTLARKEGRDANALSDVKLRKATLGKPDDILLFQTPWTRAL
jgi:glycosyltransferase involved in cell wall biosynthesis